MPRRPQPYHFGRKLLLAIFLAAVGGLGWAMWERGLKPEDVVRMVREAFPSARRTEEPPPGPGRETPPAPTTNGRPRDERPPDVKPPEPRFYSAAELQSVHTDVDAHLRAGRIKEARERISGINKLMVPAGEAAAKVRETEARVTSLHKLLLETTPGATSPLPEMFELVTIHGSNAIVVKHVNKRGDEVSYETLTGIRGRMSRQQIRELSPLSDAGRRAALDRELEKIAKSRGITMHRLSGGLAWAAPGAVTGLAFFDIADFCVRNGHNDRIVQLFEEALKRDPELVETVHEAKAERMVNVFLYFLSLRAREDARTGFAILKARYRETRAYREHVEGDADVVGGYYGLTGEAIAALPPDVIAKKPAPPQPPPPPNGTREPPPDVGKPVEPEPDRHGPTPMPVGAPEAAIKLVRDGDAAYTEGMKYMRLSDPTANPDGWGNDIRRALDHFTKAFEAYAAAQDAFERAGRSVPNALMDRFSDTQSTRYWCRKRVPRK